MALPKSYHRVCAWLLFILVVSTESTHAFCATDSVRAITTARSLFPKNGDNSSNDNMNRLDKGFNLLELAGGVVPQGFIVGTAKEGWKFAWQRMMAELAPQSSKGSYQRPKYSFQSKSNNNNPLILDATTKNRYHLYVGNPCPWCHRAVLTVNLLGLDQAIGVTRLVDDPVKASRGGWVFSPYAPDPLGNADLREVYDMLQPGFQGRCTAPLLVDTKRRQIISNESADIVRLLNQAAQRQQEKNVNSSPIDLYPSELAKDIEATNEWVYRLLNNGVYQCGFATLQSAYDQASTNVRQGLDQAEDILSRQDYLCGSTFTEADLRLLPTILRFDGAYSPLFRAGGAHLRIRCDYPAIHQWLKRCWVMPGVPESIDLQDACASYYKQLFPLNPGGLVPTSITAKELGLE